MIKQQKHLTKGFNNFNSIMGILLAIAQIACFNLLIMKLMTIKVIFSHPTLERIVILTPQKNRNFNSSAVLKLIDQEKRIFKNRTEGILVIVDLLHGSVIGILVVNESIFVGTIQVFRSKTLLSRIEWSSMCISALQNNKDTMPCTKIIIQRKLGVVHKKRKRFSKGYTLKERRGNR